MSISERCGTRLVALAAHLKRVSLQPASRRLALARVAGCARKRHARADLTKFRNTAASRQVPPATVLKCEGNATTK